MLADDGQGRGGEASAPQSTYRVQLTHGFGFDAAAEIVDYLADLGVSHLYTSPYLQAAPGSAHGYDVVDHSRVNDELGGPQAHARLCEALSAAGLGQVLDIVPNHMAIGVPGNVWWCEVLENGPSSIYAAYFDIDWDPPEPKLRHTVLAPVLGDHYGRVLDAGEIQIQRERGRFTVHYYDHALPLAPPSPAPLLARAADRCRSAELESIARALRRLPPPTATDPASVRERHQDKEVLASRLAQLCAAHPEVAAAIDEQVACVNADPPALGALLGRQSYRLAFWRTAAQELNYRRFFDIATLAGLRAEDPAVFHDTHQRVLEWVREGVLDGLRVDHPDGLRDPEAYLDRLARAAPGVWVVVEKILGPGESLPASWITAGTTGYDFLNRLTGLFIDPAGEEPLTDVYHQLTGEPAEWAEVMTAKKRLVLRELLSADLNRLAALLTQVCERHPRHRDYTRHQLREALGEVIACFPVYRSYVRAEAGVVRAQDEASVDAAIASATRHRPDLPPDLLDFLRDLLLLRAPRPASPAEPSPEAELVMQFQQLTGPVTAKGVEDTAFYVFNRFVALNEVGGDPGTFGLGVEEFHQSCLQAQQRWPSAMLASSTHDTKRSEDVRARLALLSEIPQAWAGAVRRWVQRNDRHRRDGWPDRNAEYLLYQTLVGAWPLPCDRVAAYMEKASREAKQHTSWIDPNPAYDQALRSFVEAALADEGFLADLATFVAPLVWPGRVTSLAQTLIKLTAPGVPDIYQGTELWDLSLVDPDNRRPVDYGLRRELLRALRAAPIEEILARADEGLPKLLVVHRALQLRQRRPEVFGAKSTYEPLQVSGPKAAHAVAFARRGEVVTVVPRLVLGLSGSWDHTTVRLPGGRWRDQCTGQDIDGGEVPLAELLARFPVALLEVQ